LLGVTTREGSGSNDDVFTDLPVKFVLSGSIGQSDRSASDFDGSVEFSPGMFALDAVHIEGAVIDSDNLVSEDGKVGVVLGAPHGDGDLGCVAVLFSSDFHVATLNEDVVGVEGSVVGGVIVRWEQKRSLNVDE